jgi:uncharacterized protein
VSTADTSGARAHAWAQAGQVADTQPTIPATSVGDPPDGVAPANVVWDETIGTGGYATRRLPAGSRLRLLDVDGDACVSLVLHRSGATQERLNVADTVKLQWQAYPGPGYLLLSDMGRVLASILVDDVAAHDTFCGVANQADYDISFGDGSVHGPTPNPRDRLLVALAKHGLGERDLGPVVNLFKGVLIEPDGNIRLLADRSFPGAQVVLRAEQDLIVSLVNAPHRLDPRTVYEAGRVRITAWRGAPAAADDPVRSSSPEATRAFENTEEERRLEVAR